ncbi:MAG: serine hydrolase, partial [Rhodanobacter sp.]
MRRSLRVLVTALLSSSLQATSLPADVASSPLTRPLDQIVDAVIARYHLPGIAVGVIENGHVIYVRSAGETVAGSGQPISPETLFKIASNSKAMTTA